MTKIRNNPFAAPPNREPSEGPLLSVGKRIANAFGHFWQTITHNFSSLISRISSLFSKNVTKQPVAIGDKSAINAEVSSKKASEPQVDHMKNMGAIKSAASVLAESASAVAAIPPEEPNDEEFLTSMVNEAIIQAQEALDGLEYMVVTEDHELIRGTLDFQQAHLSSLLQETKNFPAVQLRLQEKIAAIEAKMSNIEELLNTEWFKQVETILNSSHAALREVEARGEFDSEKYNQYMHFTQRLGDEHESLKQFASVFKASSPDMHEIVQATMGELEETIGKLNKKMCLFTEAQYEPNPGVSGNGSCMFFSISHQVGGWEQNDDVAEVYYRHIAADYIRNHPQDFELGVKDALNAPEAKQTMAGYSTSQGGEQAWMEKLRLELRREPTEIDRYCDCMEHSRLYGGQNELTALSEVLKRPILVFSKDRKNSDVWTVSYQNKFNDQLPILLYYNGINHYQDLVSK